MFSGLNHQGLYLYVEGSVGNMQAHCKVDRIVFRSTLGSAQGIRLYSRPQAQFFSYTDPPPCWQISSLNIPKIHFDHGQCCLSIVKLVKKKNMLA